MSTTPATGRRRTLTPAGRLAATGKYASLIAMSVLVLLPLLVILMASFKTDDEFFNSRPFDPPHSWLNFDNYVTAFTKGKMVQGFANTALILLISVTGTVIVGSMAAYAIDRFDFRGKKLVLGAFLLATLVPGVTTQVATFRSSTTSGSTTPGRQRSRCSWVPTSSPSTCSCSSCAASRASSTRPPPWRAPTRSRSTGASSCR